jgi:hypothetical protein
MIIFFIVEEEDAAEYENHIWLTCFCNKLKFEYINNHKYTYMNNITNRIYKPGSKAEQHYEAICLNKLKNIIITCMNFILINNCYIV